MFGLLNRSENADPLSESRSSDVYVPRDEAFSEVKNLTFQFKTLFSVLKSVIPSLETTMIDKDLGFPYFTAIDTLFNEGVHLPPLDNKGFLGNVLPRLLKSLGDIEKNVLLFETPEMIDSKLQFSCSLTHTNKKNLFKYFIFVDLQEISLDGLGMKNFVDKQLLVLTL